MNLEAELREQSQYPPSWRPEPGQSVCGRIVRYSVAPGRYGQVNVVTLLTDAGDRIAVWLGATALLAQFRELRPKVGERVGIAYLGRHPEKGYHLHRVVVERDQEPTFELRGGEDAEQPYVAATMAPKRAAIVGGRPAARLQADPFDE